MKHRSDYKTCEYCGANLDIGEKCDCLQEAQPEIHRKSESKKNNIPCVKIYGRINYRSGKRLAM